MSRDASSQLRMVKAERLYTYHATNLAGWTRMMEEGRVIPSVRSAEQPYHWLGTGFYLWQSAPARAWGWKRHMQIPEESRSKSAEDTVLLEFVIELDQEDYVDLLDVMWNPALALAEDAGLDWLLDLADGDQEKVDKWLDFDERVEKAVPHRLDCMLVDTVCAGFEGVKGGQPTAVRAAFQHLPRIRRGSAFRDGDHVQIAYRAYKSIVPERDLRRVFGYEWLDDKDKWLQFQPGAMGKMLSEGATQASV